MKSFIKSIEMLYNWTYIGTDDDGSLMFKCGNCQGVHRMQYVSLNSFGFEMRNERVPVPEVFYKAFEGDDFDLLGEGE